MADKRRVFTIVILFVLIFAVIISCVMPEVCDYACGYLVFRWIGHNLTVNLETDFDKAASVAFWSFDRIGGFKRYQRHKFMPVVDDNFFNIYRRGFGYCDQGAHVYATMMRFLGFESGLLTLMDENGVSPHTVAVVYIGGKPMMVDTSYKFIFADDNKRPIGVEELEDSEVFREYLAIVHDTNNSLKIKPADFKPEWFKKGIYTENLSFRRKRNLFGK